MPTLQSIGPVVELVDSWRDLAPLRRAPRPLPYRGNATWRDPASVTAIVVHQTDVLGGFDPGRQRTARHKGDARAALIERYREADPKKTNDATPYHAIVNPKFRLSIVQWPARARTSHGNGGNEHGVGFAYDGAFERDKGPSDKLDVDLLVVGLAHTICTARLQGCNLRTIEMHRQHSNMRGRDPGAELCRIAVAVGDLFGLVVEPTKVSGTGMPLPREWVAPLPADLQRHVIEVASEVASLYKPKREVILVESELEPEITSQSD